jgi:glycine/D-amino acid oxidase-like deaminating enzyme
MPSVTIVGSGLAGLSSAYFLQKAGYDVKVISSSEKKGASRVFAGILYRFPGRWGKKSKFADEAYPMSRALIDEVEQKTGRKVILSTGVIKKFSPRLKRFEGVRVEGDNSYIDDAVTIDMNEYMDGLKDLIGREHFEDRVICNILHITGPKVIAAGFGVKELLNLEHLIYRKGQQYVGRKKVAGSEYGTHIGKGHVSFLEDDRICLGSTYEREFENEHLDKEFAEKEIRSRIEPWYESLDGIEDKQFVCDVRVGQNNTYLPYVDKLDDETFVYTGLGSRGLLYHAYFAKKLVELLV